jgi:cell division transport system permease protein
MSATPLATPAQAARAAAGFSSRRDVPLVPAASIAGRALVTVIAIMTFLASLAAGSAILIAGASQDWQRSVAREMTIQVQPVAGRDIEAEIGKAVDIARNTPGIAEVSPFSKDEAEKLLEPWLGTGLDLHDLPVPRLIVLKIDDKVPPDIAALRKSLQARVFGVNLDDHRLWVARLATMANTVVVVAAAIFGLVLTAMGLAVAFATRGVMAGNREIIGILHFVGAEDDFIAREFQRHFLRLGLKGGLIGGGCAAAAFLAVGALSAALVATPGGDELEALFGSFSLGLKGYLAITVIAVMIAFATGSMSRIIVFRHLRGLE